MESCYLPKWQTTFGVVATTNDDVNDDKVTTTGESVCSNRQIWVNSDSNVTLECEMSGQYYITVSDDRHTRCRTPVTCKAFSITTSITQDAVSHFPAIGIVHHRPPVIKDADQSLDYQSVVPDQKNTYSSTAQPPMLCSEGAELEFSYGKPVRTWISSWRLGCKSDADPQQ